MNCKTIIILLITISALNSKAQITTGNIKLTEKPSNNIKVYDGFSDFKLQSSDFDYAQYIGLKVFFPGKYTYGFFEGESEYTISGPIYFTIKDIIYGEDSKMILKNVRMRSQEEKEYGPPLLVLKEEGSEKIHYYLLKNESLSNFLLVPYFLKQKELYDGKEFVIVSQPGKFLNKASNEEINYEKSLFGGVWKCEVNMLNESYPDYRRFDGVERESQNMYYILRDSLGHVITSNARDIFENATGGEDFRSVYFVKEFENDKFYNSYSNGQTRTFFMSINDYNKEINRIDKKRNKTFLKEKAITEKVKLERQKWLISLNTKYGVENAQLISQGKVKIGMNIEMCDIAWSGFYGVISRIQDSSGTFEIWKHVLYGTRLYFKNGKVFKIVDK